MALDAPAGRVAGSCPPVGAWSRLLPRGAVSGYFFRGCVHLSGSKQNCRFQLDRSSRVDNQGSSSGTHIVRDIGYDNNVGHPKRKIKSLQFAPGRIYKVRNGRSPFRTATL